MTPSTSRKTAPFALGVEAEVQGKRAALYVELILRTVGRLQLLAYGQRLRLESGERVIAAFRPRVHCEYHALATVAGCSVRSLATMDPDGVPLVRKR